MTGEDAMPGKGEWRYEIRGSSLYDNHEQRPVSNAEAGEILNAHEALLLREGVWAAKAGLAEGRFVAQAERIRVREEHADHNTVRELRAALDEATVHIEQAIHALHEPQTFPVAGLAIVHIKRVRSHVAKALAALRQPATEPEVSDGE